MGLGDVIGRFGRGAGGVLGPGGLRFGLGRELAVLDAPDVVTLRVVGVTAEGLAVLFADFATLGGLLDRQADATTRGVEFDDLDPEFLTGADDLVG